MGDSKGFVGQVFEGRYRIEAELSSGPLATIYRAVHISMQHLVTLKVLSEGVAGEDVRVARFTSDIRASSRLKHPNTVRVFDGGRAEDGHLYIAMEFLDGEPLSRLLAREDALPVARAATFARQTAKSLGEAHKAGLVHRDLRPDNIFISEVFGEKDFVKILDYGVARFVQNSVGSGNTSQGDLILGTSLYLSPEQAMGQEVDCRTDLYALGAILYEMLAGRPPFQGASPIAIAMKHVGEAVPPLSSVRPGLNVPSALEELVIRLLMKNPDDRPASAEVFVEALDAALAGWTAPQAAAVAGRPESRVTMDWGTSSPVAKAPIDTRQDDDEGIEFSSSHLPAMGPPDTPVENFQNGAAPLTPIAPSATTGNSAGAPRESAARRGIPVSWVLVAVLATALLAGAASVLLAGREDQVISSASVSQTALIAPVPAPAPTPAPTPTPVPAPVPTVVFASVLSNPTGAEVVIDGKVAGRTPYSARLIDGALPIRLVLSLPGFVPMDVLLMPSDLIAMGRTSMSYDLVSLPPQKRQATSASPKAADSGAATLKTRPIPPLEKPVPSLPPGVAPKPTKKPVLNWDE